MFVSFLKKRTFDCSENVRPRPSRRATTCARRSSLRSQCQRMSTDVDERWAQPSAICISSYIADCELWGPGLHGERNLDNHISTEGIIVKLCHVRLIELDCRHTAGRAGDSGSAKWRVVHHLQRRLQAHKKG